MGFAEIVLFCAVVFLAYANGANDNIKGAATLLGCGAASYRTAIAWASATTLLGSLCSLLFAHELLHAFSGKGLVPSEIVGSLPFVFAVASGAGFTVLAAASVGLPISTTHALVGAITGAGLVASPLGIDTGALAQTFVLPLLLSPVLAVVLGAGVYVTLHVLRRKTRIGKELCVCIGETETVTALHEPVSALALRAGATIVPSVAVQLGDYRDCRERYAGRVVGVRVEAVAVAMHFLSAGLVGFARGLNDTPKIAALLLGVQVLNVQIGLGGAALAMAIGGLTAARRVAHTMGHRITKMNPGQGLAANLATAFLVIGASRMGVPVSTTHVSVGSLFGIGAATGRGNPRMIAAIALSWLVTLPFAALSAAAVYPLF